MPRYKGKKKEGVKERYGGEGTKGWMGGEEREEEENGRRYKIGPSDLKTTLTASSQR